MKGLIVLLVVVLAFTACEQTIVDEPLKPGIESEPVVPLNPGIDVFSEETEGIIPPLPE